jgi:NAD-dependent dihydropyrimidine dehydrogenase PreA subunit
MQRTGIPAATSRRNNGRPIVPVAPVSSSIQFQATDGAQDLALQSGRSAVRTPKYEEFDETDMAYVIAEPCIGTKDNSCVEVCPVDCIHPTPDEPDYDNVEMLYIDPEECIDCDACVEACPVDACFAEDQLPEEWQQYTQINADYYARR